MITELGIGEALVFVLDEKGSPTPVKRVLIAPPASRIGPLTAKERIEVMSHSPYKTIYDKLIDRESAYEILKSRINQQTQTQTAAGNSGTTTYTTTANI